MKDKICLRCGVEKKEAKREPSICGYWGKSYKQHIWKRLIGRPSKILIK